MSKVRPSGKFISKKGGYRSYKAWNPLLKHLMINIEPLTPEELEKLFKKRKRKKRWLMSEPRMDVTFYALIDRPKIIYGDDFIVLPRRSKCIFITSSKKKARNLLRKKVLVGRKLSRVCRLIPRLSMKLNLYVIEVPRLYARYSNIDYSMGIMLSRRRIIGLAL